MALLEVRLSRGPGHLVCHTENISTSGMLLRGKDDLGPGAAFEFVFTLPDETRPIHGRAEVVRQADPAREDLQGLGARFVAFADNGRERLREFIEQRLQEEIG
jgi:hypothetical protein